MSRSDIISVMLKEPGGPDDIYTHVLIDYVQHFNLRFSMEYQTKNRVQKSNAPKQEIWVVFLFLSVLVYVYTANLNVHDACDM
jgi:hypothetical protein